MTIPNSRTFLISTILIAVVYIVTTIYLMNFVLVRNTLFGGYPLVFKVKLLLILLEGMWTAMTRWGLTLLLITAILTGANLSLLAIKITSFGGIKNTHLIVGSGSLLGIIGSGCAACGLPIISLLGLTSSVMVLPFHGAEFSLVSIILLSLSFYAMIRVTTESNSCNVTLNKAIA